MLLHAGLLWFCLMITRSVGISSFPEEAEPIATVGIEDLETYPVFIGSGPNRTPSKKGSHLNIQKILKVNRTLYIGDRDALYQMLLDSNTLDLKYQKNIGYIMAFPVSLVIMRAENNGSTDIPAAHTRPVRRPRRFMDQRSLDSFTDDEVIQHFRLNKASIMQLYEDLKDGIERRTKRSHALLGMSKLLAVLHYFATGSFQYCIGAKMGFTQPTFSRCLRQVVDSIMSISDKYISFPYNPAKREALKHLFFTKYGMPLTVGLIDCTHIALIPPAFEEQIFRNRKMYHSLNVQIICGPTGEILDVVARFPGSTHDSFVLNGSGIGQLFQSGYFNEDILLGDNGYRLSSWLLTPYLSPRSEAQQRYNNAHRRTRSLIERVFGQLKSRFRCLDVTEIHLEIKQSRHTCVSYERKTGGGVQKLCESPSFAWRNRVCLWNKCFQPHMCRLQF